MRAVQFSAVSIAAGLVSIGLMGCVTSSMTLPSVTPVNVMTADAHSKLAPITFEKSIVNLKRGTVIAHFPSSMNAKFDASLCNNTYGMDSTLEWGSGSGQLRGWASESAELFNDAMAQMGHSVTGSPTQMFDQGKDRARAEFRIAAKLISVKGNVCEEHHWWDGRPLNKFAAEFYHQIEWSVYSNFKRKVVATIITDGYGRQDRAIKQGIMTAFNNAFFAAAESLGGHPDLMAVVMRGSGDEASLQAASEAQSKAYDQLNIAKINLLKKPLNDHVEDAIAGTVTVRSGGGHGSGFILSKDGLILTNYHVAGDAEEVAVIFDSQMEVVAKVLRRNAARDVALIQVPLRGLAALPLNVEGKVRQLDDVYAIGTPATEKLKSTVTKGIISAFRKDERTELSLIQSTADISAGNSGGPLLDANGNVIAVAVAGYSTDGFSSGLNLFIPIASALEALNISIEP